MENIISKNKKAHKIFNFNFTFIKISKEEFKHISPYFNLDFCKNIRKTIILNYLILYYYG